MQTVDFHTHLLSSELSFDRIYDKLAIKFFGEKMGLDKNMALKSPYTAYTQALISNIKNSKYVSKSVIFGVDGRFDYSGTEMHRDKTVCASNEDVLKLYKENRDIFIPFFSINPMRHDALELIDKYHALGFKGAKFLQNYWGVDTRDDKYLPYFEKLAKLNIPLIVHVGSESSVLSDKSCECIEMLDAPLKAGVKTVAAHMALSYSPLRPIKAISKKPRNFGKEYHRLLAMLEMHDNLYADISALLTPVRAKALPHLASQKHIHHKLLFGTDYPVPFSAIFTSYDLPLSKRREIESEPNTLDRYTKAILEYFPKESEMYTNWQKLLT